MAYTPSNHFSPSPSTRAPHSIFPATGNFGRTALANDVGVKTQAANVVVGVCISLVLARLTDALYFIPKGTLGAVVCSAMITLIDWPEFIKASEAVDGGGVPFPFPPSTSTAPIAS